jgi:hypothetical protein
MEEESNFSIEDEIEDNEVEKFDYDEIQLGRFKKKNYSNDVINEDNQGLGISKEANQVKNLGVYQINVKKNHRDKIKWGNENDELVMKNKKRQKNGNNKGNMDDYEETQKGKEDEDDNAEEKKKKGAFKPFLEFKDEEVFWIFDCLDFY